MIINDNAPFLFKLLIQDQQCRGGPWSATMLLSPRRTHPVAPVHNGTSAIGISDNPKLRKSFNSLARLAPPLHNVTRKSFTGLPMFTLTDKVRAERQQRILSSLSRQRRWVRLQRTSPKKALLPSLAMLIAHFPATVTQG
jgi:hypothetical protein